jgi:general secretion pathway protein J
MNSTPTPSRQLNRRPSAVRAVRPTHAMRVAAADMRGMTLIEALIALVLLSLLSAGIVSAFRLGERTFSQVVRAEAASGDVALAHQFLRRILESAYPFDPLPGTTRVHYGLEGTRDRVALTAPMPSADGSKGFYRYELALLSRQDGRMDWVVRSQVDRNGEPTTPEMAAHAVHEEVLLQDIRSVRWTYLELPQGTGAATASEQPRWVDEWQGHLKPPALVRVRVEFGDARVWPDLIVAPAVTDNATCEFDVVSQRCREASL